METIHAIEQYHSRYNHDVFTEMCESIHAEISDSDYANRIIDFAVDTAIYLCGAEAYRNKAITFLEMMHNHIYYSNAVVDVFISLFEES